ncbi:hypothetical protein VTK26DRAFT_2511 [Humicola hyalothermophila]
MPRAYRAEFARPPRRCSVRRLLTSVAYYIPTVLVKRIVTVTYTSIIVLMMGRAIREWSDTNDGGSASSENQSAAVEVEATCPICQESVGERKPDGTVEGWSVLPCGHSFGSHCIKHYLGITAAGRPLCPMCRKAVSHRCGHPTLPVVVRLPSPEANRKTTSPPLMEQAHLATHEALLSLPCGYCLEVDGVYGHHSSSRSRAYRNPGYNSVWIPFAGGPWVDRYPRVRDSAWETWWKAQEPKGA